MDKKWWKEGVVYQVYPRSFMDSNGDGIGDLRGIISKLDYLHELGVDIVWISPIFQSPNDDNGYDISDYMDIMDEFGTMADFDELLDGMHARGMKMLLDLVVNHTSDEHKWFQKSIRREEPYTDYYIWRDQPNNWESHFAPSAWTYNEQRGQYYLHLFSKKQPDLNWENPQTRQAVYDVARFWLKKGVDGFRMDTVNMYSKAEGLPNMPGEGQQWAGELFLNGPHIHDYLQEMHREVFSHYDCATVGEANGVTPEMALLYVGEKRRELDMIIHFETMLLDKGLDADSKWVVHEYKPAEMRDILVKWQEALAHDGWNCLYLSNHDQPRQVSRFVNEAMHREPGAKMLATMLHTLRGTPFIYQGEELGMTNAYIDSREGYQDIETLNAIAKFEQQGQAFEEVSGHIAHFSRDNARTPMQWEVAPHAGFTTGTPWIKVNGNCIDINARQQMEDAGSVWTYYKRLIAMRKEHDSLVYGDFENLEQGHPAVFCYTRSDGKGKWYILLNMTDEALRYSLPHGFDATAQVMITNQPEVAVKQDMELPPYYAVVLHS